MMLTTPYSRGSERVKRQSEGRRSGNFDRDRGDDPVARRRASP